MPAYREPAEDIFQLPNALISFDFGGLLPTPYTHDYSEDVRRRADQFLHDVEKAAIGHASEFEDRLEYDVGYNEILLAKVTGLPVEDKRAIRPFFHILKRLTDSHVLLNDGIVVLQNHAHWTGQDGSISVNIVASHLCSILDYIEWMRRDSVSKKKKGIYFNEPFHPSAIREILFARELETKTDEGVDYYLLVKSAYPTPHQLLELNQVLFSTDLRYKIRRAFLRRVGSLFI